jgi:threonine aldolase
MDLTLHVATAEREAIQRVARMRFVDGDADVVVLENAHNNLGGVAFTREEMARQIGGRRAPVHLDGARLWNAAVALGVAPALLAGPARTVAVSLDKGLGAPYGAILAGPRDVIAEARRNAQRLGVASVHQAGIFAAAGLVALDGIDRLADDHRRAAALADGLAELPGVEVPRVEPRTNVVVVEVDGAAGVAERLGQRGVLALPRSERVLRFVTHRGVDDAAVGRTLDAARAALG